MVRCISCYGSPLLSAAYLRARTTVSSLPMDPLSGAGRSSGLCHPWSFWKASAPIILVAQAFRVIVAAGLSFPWLGRCWRGDYSRLQEASFHLHYWKPMLRVQCGWGRRLQWPSRGWLPSPRSSSTYPGPAFSCCPEPLIAERVERVGLHSPYPGWWSSKNSSCALT